MKTEMLKYWPVLKPAPSGSVVEQSQWQALNNMLFDEDELRRVESYFRNCAIENRQVAVELARLIEWKPNADDMPGYMRWSQLSEVITTLARFPENESLFVHLQKLKLVPEGPFDESTMGKLLIAADYGNALGHSHFFDAETGMVPVKHNRLLVQLTESTDLEGAVFEEVPPTDFDDHDATYLLKGEFKGQSFEVTAQNFGDYYNVDAVAELLNKMAHEFSMKSRFVSLPTGSQEALVWIVNEEPLNELLRDGLIYAGH